MPTFTLPDGSRREYIDAGSPANPAVLILHDRTQRADEMAPFVRALEARYRVIVPDRPHAAAPQADATALLRLLKEAEAGPTAVVGIGAGAATAVHMAVQESGTVYRIIADSLRLADAPEALLGDLLCHVIVAWGAEDEHIAREETVRLALAIPRAQRRDYPCGCGVFAHLPEAFATDVLHWLDAPAPGAKLPLNEEPPRESFGV